MKKPVIAVIAEDEAPQRQELAALLGELWPDLVIAAVCEDGLAAMEAVEAHKPQVVFLDIRMPGVSGIEVARAASAFAHIVFVTAYDEFAVRAFEDGAVDYVLKPVRRERLGVAIARIQERLKSGAAPDLAQLMAVLAEQGRVHETRPIKWITAQAGGVTKMIPIDEVQFFQAEDKYTRVATATEDAHIRAPLKELLPQLDPEIFWQVHRSVIVRVSSIRTIKRDEDGKLRLVLTRKGESLPVSSAFQHRFKAM
jgi:DNA-binding LytR/AlgR family response regulator